jgi:hypothetical protein
MRKTIIVNDLMQKNFEYQLMEPEGKNFDEGFDPDLSPKQMLEMGVFGGRYMTDCAKEYPKSWFLKAKLCPTEHKAELNFFGVNASQPLSVWRAKGWIYKDDPRGWFQWYCRYYAGRRLPAEDQRQIKRWRAMKRHVSQVKNNCLPGDLKCRIKQRQALLHWAYDSRNI